MFEASGYPLPLKIFDVPKNLTSVGEAKWSRIMYILRCRIDIVGHTVDG